MPHVYECRLCGKIMLNKGLKLHLARVHGITDNDAGVINDSLDITIDHIGVPFGNIGYVFKLGHVVARWLFEVGGKHATKFISGNIIPYRLWVNDRIRLVNNRPFVNIMAPTYLEDYLKHGGT